MKHKSYHILNDKGFEPEYYCPECQQEELRAVMVAEDAPATGETGLALLTDDEMTICFDKAHRQVEYNKDIDPDDHQFQSHYRFLLLEAQARKQLAADKIKYGVKK